MIPKHIIEKAIAGGWHKDWKLTVKGLDVADFLVGNIGGMNLEQETADMLKTLREGCWIGEDGNAVCIAQNKREALRTIKALMRRDCGEAEARSIKSDEISVGWARLATQKEKEETWSEFFVMYKEESPYKCYVLRV